MTNTTRTVVVAAVLALAVCAGVALGSTATTTTTDEQTNETASVSVSDQQFDGESITVESATLPDGGFAVVHYDGDVRVGHTDYLEPGDHENVTVSLNRSFEDSQALVVTLYHANGTETYDASEVTTAYETDSSVNVSDVAYVYFEERGQNADDAETSTAETTAAMTDEAADETTTEAAMADDESGDETTDDATGGVPGFTPITAVVALLAAALVASRRR